MGGGGEGGGCSNACTRVFVGCTNYDSIDAQRDLINLSFSESFS